MRDSSFLAIIAGALLSVMTANLARSQDRTATDAIEPVGLILKVECSVSLVPLRTGQAIPIDHDRGCGRPLYTGDKLQCTGDGKLIVWLDGQTKAISASQSWVLVGAQTTSEKQRDVAKAIDSLYTDRATRDPMPFLFNPAAGGIVRPETFVVRWNDTLRESGSVSVSIWSADGSKLCCNQPIRAASSSGKLDSGEIRNALMSYRKSDGQSLLELRFVDSADKLMVVKFSLLGSDKEKILQQQLDNWNKEPNPVVRHLGRAFAYRSNTLYVEAADEFDQLLKEEPRCENLIDMAIQQNRDAGDVKRVKQLEKLRSQIRAR